MNGDMMQHFYGAVTVGERGQVVIPQAAREIMGIRPGDKILVLGAGPDRQGLIMIKAETLNGFLAAMTAKFNDRLNQIEKILLSAEKPEDPDQKG